jgi:hypothetical protein
MIDTIIISILSIVVIVLLYGLAYIKKKQIDQFLVLIQSQLDNDLLSKRLAQIAQEKQLVESEDFMRFMTESRDYAFEYISTVQEAVKEYNNAIEPVFAYYLKYGKLMGESPDTDHLDKIIAAHTEFMKIMPSEPGK